MARTSSKSAQTLDAAQGNEQNLRAQVSDLTKLLAQAKADEAEMVAALADKCLSLETALAEKERKLVSAFGFVRKYRAQLEAAGLMERASTPVDDVLAARRAAMAAAKAEAMAGAPGTSVAVK